MEFRAFVWRAEAREFTGSKGDAVHFSELELAEVEGAYTGPMCVVNGGEGVSDDFKGFGIYTVSAHFRRRDRATVLSVEGLVREESSASATGLASGESVPPAANGELGSLAAEEYLTELVTATAVAEKKGGK